MRALPLLLLLPGLALAQTGLIVQPATPPRGVTLPPTSAALVDEATALSVNPAGLRFIGPAQLFYLHERDVVHDSLGDGVYLGTSLLGTLGAGFSLEWMRGHGLPDYRKTSLGLALGSGKLSLGVGYHNFASDDASLDRLATWDLGLTVRPARFLSVGAVVRDVNAPTQGPFTLPRRYNLAVGVRPFGERLTLGADYLANEGAWGDGRMSYTLLASLLPGLGVSAGLSHGLGADHTLALQFALTLDSSHFGLTYAGGGVDGDGLDHVLAVRLSSQKYPGSEKTIDIIRQELVGTIGENIVVRRWERLEAKEAGGFVHAYIHMGGKLAVLLHAEAPTLEHTTHPEFRNFIDNSAMQVAAMNP
ncbi:MAG: hypothetical protein ACXU86_00180, partial [Archangium sp.]